MKQLLLHPYPFILHHVQCLLASYSSIASQAKASYGCHTKGKFAMEIVVIGRGDGRRTWLGNAIDTTCDNCCANPPSHSHSSKKLLKSKKERRTPEQAHSAKLTHHITRFTCCTRQSTCEREREDAASHAPKTSQRRSPDE